MSAKTEIPTTARSNAKASEIQRRFWQIQANDPAGDSLWTTDQALAVLNRKRAWWHQQKIPPARYLGPKRIAVFHARTILALLDREKGAA